MAVPACSTRASPCLPAASRTGAVAALVPVSVRSTRAGTRGRTRSPASARGACRAARRMGLRRRGRAWSPEASAEDVGGEGSRTQRSPRESLGSSTSCRVPSLVPIRTSRPRRIWRREGSYSDSFLPELHPTSAGRAGSCEGRRQRERGGAPKAWALLRRSLSGRECPGIYRFLQDCGGFVIH